VVMRATSLSLASMSAPMTRSMAKRAVTATRHKVHGRRAFLRWGGREVPAEGEVRRGE
jgi:hypothetical protein